MKTLIKRYEAQVGVRSERAERSRAQVEALVPPIAERFGGEGVWLFGSLAWGEPDEASDVDLAVRGLASHLRDDLAAELWMAIDADVDGVLLESAPVSLVERVLDHGVRVYARSA